MIEFRQNTDDLFSRFVKGDCNAFGEFVEAVRSLTINYFLRRGRRLQEIEDAIQGVAIRLLEKPPRWKAGRSAAVSYFLSIVNRRLFDDWKRRGNRGQKVKRFSELDNQQRRRGFDVAAPRKTEVEDFAGKDTVAAAIETLTDKQKEIVRLRFESGLSVLETAKALGLKHKSTVDDQFICIGNRFRKNPMIRELLELDPLPITKIKPSVVPPNELSEKQWAVVRLVHDDGKSYGEAAKLLGWERDAVRSAWRRACGRIAKSENLQALTGIVPDSKA